MALAESVEPRERLPAVRPRSAPSGSFSARASSRVAGVDEAGRGPLAGPVVAAAVVLDPKKHPEGSRRFQGADRRRSARRSSRDLQARGNLRRLRLGRRRSTASTSCRRRSSPCGAPCAAFPCRSTPRSIDGNVVPQKMPCEARPIVDGDATCLSIAAASIVAKVIRDRLMARCDARFAGYGLASHKGYSTKAHQAALDGARPLPTAPPQLLARRGVLRAGAGRSVGGVGGLTRKTCRHAMARPRHPLRDA